MKSTRVATAPLVLLLLSGCVLGPDHKPPEIALPTSFSEGGKTSNGDVSGNAWWTAFSDKRLNGYVTEGLDQNLDVLQALERINQAQAAVVSAGAGGLPSLDLAAQGERSGAKYMGGNTEAAVASSTTPSTSVSGGLTASWFLDLFGLYRRQKEAALDNLDAAYANVDVARLTLLSDVASAYVDVRYYQELANIAQANLKSRRETLNLTKLQLDAGAASRLDVVQAEGLVNSTLADIPGIQTEIRTSAHKIATLLGKPAGSMVGELLKGGGQPVARFNPKSGVPADLIRNRPDVRAAERTLAAATANIGVAEAQLYPAITLGGSITPSYMKTGHNAETGLLSWSFGPSLSLPIFDGGALKANLTSAQSTAREDYLAWKEVVLNGVQEVENALSAISRDGQTVDANRKTVKSYQEALQLATASYRDGASSLLDVLDAQRAVSTAQQGLAAAVQQMATDYISLNVAIGGGYAVGKTAPAAKTVVAKK